MRPVLIALAWLWGVAAAALTGLRWVDATGPVPVLQAGLVPVGLSLVPLAALAWALGRRALLTGVVLLGLVHGAVALPWWTSEAVEAGPTERELVVATANLEYGQGSLEDLADLVTDREVDALVLLEVTPAFEQALEGSPVDRALPDRAGTVRSDAGGTLVLLRDGVAGGGAQVLGGDSSFVFDQVLAPVSSGGEGITLLGAHTRPPAPGGSAGWRAELLRLADAAAAVDGPLLVVGDLNASTGHPVLRDLLRETDLRDAHEAAGSGWVRTWPAEGLLPAFVQIDHVLVREAAVVDAGAVGVAGSDHAAVWTRLRLP